MLLPSVRGSRQAFADVVRSTFLSMYVFRLHWVRGDGTALAPSATGCDDDDEPEAVAAAVRALGLGELAADATVRLQCYPKRREEWWAAELALRAPGTRLVDCEAEGEAARAKQHTLCIVELDALSRDGVPWCLPSPCRPRAASSPCGAAQPRAALRAPLPPAPPSLTHQVKLALPPHPQARAHVQRGRAGTGTSRCAGQGGWSAAHRARPRSAHKRAERLRARNRRSSRRCSRPQGARSGRRCGTCSRQSPSSSAAY